MSKTKFIFVTGGVMSSLGKGLASASIGALLECRGLRGTLRSLDPYINVDPGTMDPFQHGEVYVTDDGAETDQDLGQTVQVSPHITDEIKSYILDVANNNFVQAEDGIRAAAVTGVQTCALPIWSSAPPPVGTTATPPARSATTGGKSV